MADTNKLKRKSREREERSFKWVILGLEGITLLALGYFFSIASESLAASTGMYIASVGSTIVFGMVSTATNKDPVHRVLADNAWTILAVGAFMSAIWYGGVDVFTQFEGVNLSLIYSIPFSVLLVIALADREARSEAEAFSVSR